MLAEPAPDLLGRAGEPSRADLPPQCGGILAAFGKPRVEICEMRINDTVSSDTQNPTAGDIENPAPSHAVTPLVADDILDLSSSDRRFSRRR